MLTDLTSLQATLEIAETDLARIPRTAWNVRKITDREQAIAGLKRQIGRIEATHQAFIDRRHELAARSGQRQPVIA